MNVVKKEVVYEFVKTVCDYLDGFKSDDVAVTFADDVKEGSEYVEDNNSCSIDTLVLGQLLDEVAREVRVCNNCPLFQTRNYTVFGEGPLECSGNDTSPLVMVIGEGPGAEEDRTGRPFVGNAGKLLDKMLQAINLSRKTNCYIANIVKCRPPNNRTPNPDEIRACRGYIEKQIELIKPKMLLLMGRTAVHTILDTSEGIGRIHGKMYEYKGIPAMATYHPSALLHNEGLKRPAWEDLKKFKVVLDNSSL